VSVLSGAATTIPGFSGAGTSIPVPTIVGGSGSISQGGGSSVTTVPVPGLSLSALGGLIFDLFALVAALSLIGIFVIIVVANRADPDPSGRRPQSVYYFAVAFMTLSLAILGSAVVVSGVVTVIGTHSNATTNAAARAIVLGGLTTLVSLVLLVAHLRRGLGLARADGQMQGPSRRVGQSYISSVAFVSVLSLVVFWVFSVYVVFTLVSPGVFGSFGGRADAARVLIVAVYLWVVAAIVLKVHRNLMTPELQIFGGHGVAASHPSPE